MEELVKEQAKKQDCWTEKQRNGASFNKSQLNLWISKFSSIAETQKKKKGGYQHYFRKDYVQKMRALKEITLELAMSNPKKCEEEK